MKLSKLFHSLYAILMFLPVMVIPIFAININQKSVEPVQIQVQENLVVDFNQQRQNNLSSGTFVTNGQYIQYAKQNLVLQYDHIYYTSMYIKASENSTIWYRLGSNSAVEYLVSLNMTTDYMFVSTQTRLTYVNDGNNACYFMTPTNMQNITIDFYDLMCIDLTQMFGIGNEPSNAQFREWYPNTYYNFTMSHTESIPNVLTTYNDTDIGSQFLYSLYIPVHDYFNFGEFFGLSGMYDWFTLNIFNGTAPLSFFIVFNIMIYWLFISLFWLLFDILIYVPMVIHKWLDKAEM